MANLERNWVKKPMTGHHELDGAVVKVTKEVDISMKEMLMFISDNWMEIPLHLRDGFKNKVNKMELGIIKPDVDHPEDDPYW